MSVFDDPDDREWFVCKTCQRFTLQVNKHGLCYKCSKKDKAPGPIMFASFMHEWAPINSYGKVLSRTSWKRIKKKVEDFYKYVPPSDYRIWNVSVAERRRRAKTPAPSEGSIYLIKSENGYYKIGRTSRGVELRKEEHEMDYPMKLRLVHSFKSSTVKRDERRLLNSFKESNLRGEWFELDYHDVAWFSDIEDYSMGAAFLKFKQRKRLYPRPKTLIGRVKAKIRRFFRD